MFVGLCSFVFAQPTALQPRDPSFVSKKENRRAEIGWCPTPEKNIETMPCWDFLKKSPENCLVGLGRDTRTSTQSLRLVRRKGASWSLNWPSGANLQAHFQLKCILYVPL